MNGFTRREWIVLVVLMVPTLLGSMDLAVTNLAVPHISGDLQPTSNQLLWIVDIYGFMIAGSLITMGTLGDRIGQRKLLLLGAAAFGIASILAAFSPTADMLIISRALLGVAGATLAPSSLSLIRNMFLDPRRRTIAIGIWAIGFSAGNVLGLVIGGFLLERFWWGAVFLLDVPFVVILLIIGSILLPEYKNAKPGKFDLISAGLSLVAVLLVIYGLKLVALEGVAPPQLISIAAGLVVSAIFVHRQRILPDPLIDLKLFRVRTFTAPLVTNIIGMFIALGISLFINQYLQLVLGLSPLQAGLWSVPNAIASLVGANSLSVLVRRMHPGFVVAGGMVFAAFGLGLITQVGGDTLALVVIGSGLMYLGYGISFTLTIDMTIGAAPPARAGAASGISRMSSEFGGALGVAILGSLGMAIYGTQVAAALPAEIPPAVTAAAQGSLGGALGVAAKLPEAIGAVLSTVADKAFIDGLQTIALIGTIGFAIIALVSAVLLRHVQLPGGDPQGEPPLEGAPALNDERGLEPVS